MSEERTLVAGVDFPGGSRPEAKVIVVLGRGIGKSLLVAQFREELRKLQADAQANGGPARDPDWVVMDELATISLDSWASLEAGAEAEKRAMARSQAVALTQALAEGPPRRLEPRKDNQGYARDAREQSRLHAQRAAQRLKHQR